LRNRDYSDDVINQSAWLRLLSDLREFWRSISENEERWSGACPSDLAPIIASYYSALWDSVRTGAGLTKSSEDAYRIKLHIQTQALDTALPPNALPAGSTRSLIGYRESMGNYETRDTVLVVAPFPAEGIWEKAIERSWQDASVPEHYRNRWPRHPFQFCFRVSTTDDGNPRNSLWATLFSADLSRWLAPRSESGKDQPATDATLAQPAAAPNGGSQRLSSDASGTLKSAEPSRNETRTAARCAVVEPILKKKNWTRHKWGTVAGVGKNCPYEYLKGTRCLTPTNRRAMAEALGLTSEKLPND